MKLLAIYVSLFAVCALWLGLHATAVLRWLSNGPQFTREVVYGFVDCLLWRADDCGHCNDGYHIGMLAALMLQAAAWWLIAYVAVKAPFAGNPIGDWIRS